MLLRWSEPLVIARIICSNYVLSAYLDTAVTVCMFMLAKLRFCYAIVGFVLCLSIYALFSVFPSVPSGFLNEWPMSSHDSLAFALTPESPHQESTVRHGRNIYTTDGTCSFITDGKSPPFSAARSGLARGVVPKVVKPRLPRGVRSP